MEVLEKLDMSMKELTLDLVKYKEDSPMSYSIDSQLRMIKEYCEKNNYSIVDVYNDAGHSGKDLMRPEMQRILADFKSKKIDKLIAIKVDRLTRNMENIRENNNKFFI